MINWKVNSKEEYLKLANLTKKFLEAFPDYPDDFLTLNMDLTACHANGNPLDLDGMIDATHDLPDGQNALDLVHDVYGIRRHINRKTGKLEDFFVPRFSK